MINTLEYQIQSSNSNKSEINDIDIENDNNPTQARAKPKPKPKYNKPWQRFQFIERAVNRLKCAFVVVRAVHAVSPSLAQALH